MSAAALIDRLDHVRRTGPDRWLARCPAHEDRSPSLSIRELDDARVLVHCFAGCAVTDVLQAVGLELDVLFAEPDRHDSRRGQARPFPASDVLRAIAFEVLIVATCASAIGAGTELTEKDRSRLLVAASRINAALDAAGIRHAWMTK